MYIYKHVYWEKMRYKQVAGVRVHSRIEGLSTRKSAGQTDGTDWNWIRMEENEPDGMVRIEVENSVERRIEGDCE